MMRSTILLPLALLQNVCSLDTTFTSATVLDQDRGVELDGYEYDDIVGANVDPHPDPNDEDYHDMVYVGRLDDDGKRLSADYDHLVKFIFGTSFDESHKDIAHEDLQHRHYGPGIEYDIAQRDKDALFKERHGTVDVERGPKRYGHVDIDPLDGGVTPPHVVRIEPFFLDTTLVTNQQFAKFVASTYYETEAEKYGWSFVLSSFLGAEQLQHNEHEADPDAPHWIAVNDATWRQPEGPGSSYARRLKHPVVHVSHRDAAEYCQWVGKRLPGEREWEAAARTSKIGPNNRTIYSWGEDGTWETASQYANLWGPGVFPDDNKAMDGWRGTSPVKTYPANEFGFYDMTGNVWEWTRGGKHKERIVRGGSYVDSLDGSFNHAATLGARSTLHGTTTTGNVGFRCAKSPKRRVEHHYQWHDESTKGKLAVEDQFGRRDMVPQRGWEDLFDPDSNDDEWLDPDEDAPKLKKKKVVKRRERLSTEL